MIRQLHSGDCISAFGMRTTYWGKRIYTYYAAYGTEYDFCKFYGCTTDNCFGIIMIFNATMTIWSHNEPDETFSEELSSFILMHSPQRIEAPFHISANLKIGSQYHTKQRFLFKMVTDKSFMASDLCVEKKPNLDKVYEILKESFDDTTDYGLWLTDTSHRRRRNLTTLYLFEKSTTATVIFEDESFAFIGQIATLKSHRGHGGARKLLYYIACALEEKGKTGYLFAYPERKSFYEEIGFECVEEDYIIIKNENQSDLPNDFADYREY